MTQNFELFKTGMGSDNFITVINQNEQTQAEFISTLEKSKFTYPEILELMKVTQDRQVKSLLIIYLLSQKNYISSLVGESVLNRLANTDTYSPSRLNALVHELDMRTLTTSLIGKFQPEAAVSLLCSVPHFHQFKEVQVEALLKKNSLPMVITYWLNHFAAMPNAYFTTAHLMKLASAEISAALNKMDESKKDGIITNIIKHLGLFNPRDVLFLERPDENHLILAMRLFLNGHFHAAYVTYITDLTSNLLNQNHPFSIQAIQLLISLNRTPEFSALNNKVSHLTNRYLRTCAQSADIGVFYDADRINVLSMIQPIQLKPSEPNSSTLKGLLSSFIGSSTKPDDEQATVPSNDENPLVKMLMQLEKPIISFDYFLMHYKGRGTKIAKVISDYLDYYAHGTRELRTKPIYHTCMLMTRKELDPVVREALFTSFLRYPELYDAQISYCMLRYDAKRAIKYFGSRGGEEHYKRVVDLCTGALTKLDPKYHQDIINIAQKAQSEALIELGFSENRGFFSRLFRRFIRCWKSGWTGFFSPNLPVYVVPEEAVISPDVVDPDDHSENIHLPSEPKKTLSILLGESKNKLVQQTLDALINTLKDYSLEASPKDEVELRRSIHNLFHKLLQESKQNKGLDNWLIRHQEPFIVNRFRLLELLLEKGSQAEVRSLIEEVNGDSSHFQQLTQELYCELPEQLAEVPIEQETVPEITFSNTATELVDVASELVVTASGYVGAATGYATSWASALSGFFSIPEPSEPPPIANKAPSLV